MFETISIYVAMFRRLFPCHNVAVMTWVQTIRIRVVSDGGFADSGRELGQMAAAIRGLDTEAVIPIFKCIGEI